MESKHNAVVKHEGGAVHYDLYRASDESPNLVLVHGAACHRGLWHAQVADLGQDANLLVVDLPGHGGSDPATGELSMERLAAAVLAAMEAVEMPQAVLVGHSMGGPVIRQLYRLAPERVSAIVVLDGFFSLEDPASGEPILALYRQDFESLWPMFVEMLITDGAADEVADAVRQTMLSAPRELVLRLMAGIYDPAVWQGLELEVPLTVVMAEKTTLPANYEQLLRSEFAQVDYRVIDGVGHFLQMEKPAEINRILRAALGVR